jgi:glucokinase
MAYLGVDLGGTKLASAAFTDRGELLYRETVPLADRQGGDVGSLIADRLREIGSKYGAEGAGVCIPGLYRATRGTVWAPNIPGWADYPLRSVLRDALGAALPVAIDSDRAAYILGETWRGAAQGARDAIFLAVGTGIGAGILAGGRVLRGHGDVAGAIGWLALDRTFQPRWKMHGCFEDQASGPGLVRVTRDLLESDSTYDGELRKKATRLETGDVFAAHDRGDALAAKVIDNAVELWGMAAANLVSLFNPQMIIFGGGVFGPATQHLESIKIEAKRWAQPIAIEQVQFVGSALGSDAGLFGAGRLAMTPHEEAEW